MCVVGEKAVQCSVIDKQMDAIIEAIALDPSWQDGIIAKLGVISEHERIFKERKRISERLKRLSKVYVDSVIEDIFCSLCTILYDLIALFPLASAVVYVPVGRGETQ